MTTDEGLTAGTQAWLAGAGQRLNEPVREDRREDVQARIDEIARDRGGRIVRAAWDAWAREQPDVNDHPSWTVPYDDLPERDREVDRRIYEACRADVTDRTARKIRDVQASVAGTGPDRNDFERGWLHAARSAAVIARETR